MLILGIETATPQVGVAIADENDVLASLHAGGDRRHAEALVPSISFVAEQAQVTLRDLDAVAVDVGPGLFTGLRVGLATAKAVAHACQIPLIGVTSLEVLAFGARFDTRHILATVDARRSEIFHATYRGTHDGAGVMCVVSPAVDEPARVVDRLAEPGVVDRLAEPGVVDRLAEPGMGYLAVGDGALRYRELFEAVPEIGLAPKSMCHPSAAVLAELAHTRAANGEFASPLDLVPLYLRAPDAQVNWEQRVRA